MRSSILCIAIITTFIISAQAQSANEVRQKSLLKFGLVHIKYEAKLSQNFTIIPKAGLAFIFGYGGKDIGTIVDYGLAVGLSPRYYYNFKSRLRRGKSIQNYSGNYISFYTRAVLNSLFSRPRNHNRYVLGPTWGLQRALGKHWYFNFQVGPGIEISNEISKVKTKFRLIIGLDIGFQSF